MQDAVVFVSVTLVLTLISRHSLSKPGVSGYAHGFYRFIAWECMLGLFVLNMHVWYDDYYSPRQLFSGVLFLLSLLLLIFSVVLLRWMGKPDAKRDDVPMIAFEKTTALVTNGIYRFIRHPMYSSLLLFCWGLFFKQPSIAGSLLAASASILLVTTSRVEERESVKYFGDAYREYMKRTKMFVPFIV